MIIVLLKPKFILSHQSDHLHLGNHEFDVCYILKCMLR